MFGKHSIRFITFLCNSLNHSGMLMVLFVYSSFNFLTETFKLETVFNCFIDLSPVPLKFLKSILFCTYEEQKQPFFEKGIHKNFAIFTGKHLCWNLFLIELQWIEILWKFKKGFFIEYLRWLLPEEPTETYLVTCQLSLMKSFYKYI